MSVASYERNVAKNVTGPEFPTCFPSALEQLAPRHGYHPDVYRDYTDYIETIADMPGRKMVTVCPETKAVYNHLLGSLGGLTFDDAEFRHARTPLAWMRIVKAMHRQGMAVVADVHYQNRYVAHSVGIVPVEGKDMVELVSTHIPKDLRGVVPLQRVAQKMTVIADHNEFLPEYPFNDANIVGVPMLD
jgi:hypothetical protein